LTVQPRMCIVPGRGGAAAARRAHNPKVRGSNPLPATKDESTSEPRPARRGSCFLGRRPRGILTSFRASAPGRPSVPQDRGCRDGVGRRAGCGCPGNPRTGQSLDRLEGVALRGSPDTRAGGDPSLRPGERGHVALVRSGHVHGRPGLPRDTLTGPAGGREDSGGGSGGRLSPPPGQLARRRPARHGRHATRTGTRLAPHDSRRAWVGSAICTRRGRPSRPARQVLSPAPQVLPYARDADLRPVAVVRCAPRRPPDLSRTRHRGVLDPAHARADHDTRRAEPRRDDERPPGVHLSGIAGPRRRLARRWWHPPRHVPADVVRRAAATACGRDSARLLPRPVSPATVRLPRRFASRDSARLLPRPAAPRQSGRGLLPAERARREDRSAGRPCAEEQERPHGVAGAGAEADPERISQRRGRDERGERAEHAG
jgi:hypothetical protein